MLGVSAGRATTVPAVVDLTVEQAQTLLTNAGLTAEITTQTADAPTGAVLSQDPVAGAVVGKGSTVRLTVSAGPATPPSTYNSFQNEAAAA